MPPTGLVIASLWALVIRGNCTPCVVELIFTAVLPVPLSVIRLWLFAFSTRFWASLVPIKWVAEFVPALPVKPQPLPALPPIAVQAEPL